MENKAKDTECDVLKGEGLRFLIADVVQMAIFLSCLTWLIKRKGDRITNTTKFKLYLFAIFLANRGGMILINGLNNTDSFALRNVIFYSNFLMYTLFYWMIYKMKYISTMLDYLNTKTLD